MSKPITRQDSKAVGSKVSKSPSKKTVVDPNLTNLSSRGGVKVTTGSSGRGATPKNRVVPEAGLLSAQASSSSIRATRASPVSQLTESEENFCNFDRVVPPESFTEVDTGSLGNLQIEDMATGGGNQENNRSTSNSGMDDLLAYFQEAMRNTQEEFRRELSALRDNMRTLGNNRADAGAPRVSNQSSVSHSNASFPLSFKLKDWKISYSGDGSVSDFLFKLDTLVERSQCPHDHLMSNFHIFLTGKAETFYWDYIRQYQRATYPMLKTALSREFGSRENDHEILLKISTRKQLPKESYDDYHSFIVRWNLRLSNPLADASLIEIIKKNVNADLKVMLFISEPRDLSSLRDLARRAEKVLLENKNVNLTRQRQVNEIAVEMTPSDSDIEIDPQVEALKINRSFVPGDYSKIKCWNCLQLGHSYIYCPDENRHIFCFKCGKRGVTTVKCDGSHTGNGRRSEWATGDARSSK